MHPVYYRPQSFPQQQNHLSYPYDYSPGWEVMIPHAKTDPTDYPVYSRPWQYGGSYWYANAPECHGCCNHSYSPVCYSYRPPHTHLLPPRPLYYYGPYPPYHEAIAPYHDPRYEYDKNMARDHCCGCLNHTCNKKIDKNVKFEEEKQEEKSEDEKKFLKKSPFPIIWMPPEYMERDNAKCLTPDYRNLNGWIPLGLNNARSVEKGGDENRRDNKQVDDKTPQFQWPPIWFPGYNGAGEVEKRDLKDVDASSKEKDFPQSFKIIPVKLVENKNRCDKPGVAEDTVSDGHSSTGVDKEKETKPKSVVVEKDSTPKNIQVMPIDENVEKHSDSAPKKSSSPRKSSKLPPVCLRVDPLPKKKNGNGTSRSPSPPASKDREQKGLKGQDPNTKSERQAGDKGVRLVNVEEKALATGQVKEQKSLSREVEVVSVDKAPQSNQTKEEKRSKEVKVVNVKEKSSEAVEAKEGLVKGNNMRAIDAKENMDSLTAVVKKQESLEALGLADKEQAKSEVSTPLCLSQGLPVKPVAEEVERCEDNSEKGASEKKNVDEIRVRRKLLSNEEAAILIQSAYRGYEVRKWEPLKKLKQIARIREQVADIKRQIGDLETSFKLQHDDKKRIFINETIMNMLLQLDTIQGLHPAVREMRKSVAKELVCLQERLDNLANHVANSSLTTESPPDVMESAVTLVSKDANSDPEEMKRSMETMMTTKEEPCTEQIATPGSQAVSGDELGTEQDQLELKQERSEDLSAPVDERDSSSVGEETSELQTVKEQTPNSESVDILQLPSSIINDTEQTSEKEKGYIETQAMKDQIHEDLGMDDQLVETVHEEQPLDSGLVDVQETIPAKEEEVSCKLEENLEPSLLEDDEVEENLELPQENEGTSPMPKLVETPSNQEESMEFVAEALPVLPEADTDFEMETMSVAENEVSSKEPESKAMGNEMESPEAIQPDTQQKCADENRLVEGGSSEIVEIQPLSCVSNNNETSMPMIKELVKEHDNVDTAVHMDNVMEMNSPGHPISEYTDPSFLEQKNSDDPTTESPKVEEKCVQQSSEVALEPTQSYDTTNVDNASDDMSCCGVKSDDTSSTEGKEGKDLVGGNEMLKEMLEKLVMVGQRQYEVISDLNGRVKDLEKKLARKKKLKMMRRKAVNSSGSKKVVDQRASVASAV